MTVKQYQDNFYITISYEDGDGNLGSEDPDLNNVFVIDNRIGLEYAFRLRDLSTPNGSPAINGDLTIEMPPTGIVESSDLSQQADFTVYMVDAEGNKSNEETTLEITVEE